MTQKELQRFLDEQTESGSYYGRELYYYYTQVLHINTKLIYVTSLTNNNIHFQFFGYGQERKNSKVSYTEFNEIKRMNYVHRLVDDPLEEINEGYL